jgi:hypothetical protein
LIHSIRFPHHLHCFLSCSPALLRSCSPALLVSWSPALLLKMEGEIHDWLVQFSEQPIKIWCEDPETNQEKIGNGVLAIGKTFLTYRILMKQVGRDLVGVRHRYSEFQALRKSLRDRYGPLGIIVPSLPPKDSMSSMIGVNQKQTFIKERTLGLTLFCEVQSDY